MSESGREGPAGATFSKSMELMSEVFPAPFFPATNTTGVPRWHLGSPSVSSLPYSSSSYLKVSERVSE